MISNIIGLILIGVFCAVMFLTVAGGKGERAWVAVAGAGPLVGLVVVLGIIKTVGPSELYRITEALPAPTRFDPSLIIGIAAVGVCLLAPAALVVMAAVDKPIAPTSHRMGDH